MRASLVDKKPHSHQHVINKTFLNLIGLEAVKKPDGIIKESCEPESRKMVCFYVRDQLCFIRLTYNLLLLFFLFLNKLFSMW